MQVRDTRPFSNSTPPCQLRTNWIPIKWQTQLWLKCMVSATCSYNVRIHIKNFLANLDESWEWPWGPPKKLEFWWKPEAITGSNYIHSCVLRKWAGMYCHQAFQTRVFSGRQSPETRFLQPTQIYSRGCFGLEVRKSGGFCFVFLGDTAFLV